MKKNIKGFSLVIAMGLVLVSSLLAYTILEYMVPFSKNIKGIENSTKSYYMANTGLERGLYFFSKREGVDILDEDNSKFTFSGGVDYDFKYQTYSSTNDTLPVPGKGNSELDEDKNWNELAIGNPIQLSVGYKFLPSISTVSIKFRVPDLDGDLAFDDFELDGTEPKISWQLSSQSDTLNSTTGSLIKADKINKNNVETISINLANLMGQNLDGNPPQTFLTFFDNCDEDTEKCILKFSIISDLKTTTGINIPYLEWQMNLGTSLPSNNLPLRYSTLEATGKSYGFSKKLEIKHPQETVSEAFDFTVFQ